MSLEAAARLLGNGWVPDTWRIEGGNGLVKYRQPDGHATFLAGDALCGALLDKLAEMGAVPSLEYYGGSNEWCASSEKATEEAFGPTRLAAVLALVGKL